MCKLFAATSLPVADWAKIRHAVLAAMATTERDGLGAAWGTDKKGSVGRVRASGMDALNAMPEIPPFCEGFAKWDNHEYNGGPVLCHGRTSTNYLGLSNTHPFLKTDKDTGTVYVLAHNGVVTSEKYKGRVGGCDSELILAAFMAGGMKEVAAHIDGYFALVIIEKRKNGEELLHVIRDGTANLICGRIGDAWAFATTETILRAAGATPVTNFKRHMHVTFKGNEMARCKPFVQTAPKTDKGVYYVRSRAGTALAGQQYLLEQEEEEEARLQQKLAEMEEKGLHPTDEPPEDETMNERGSLADWPGHGGGYGRGAYD